MSDGGDRVELPDGGSIAIPDLDLGMREVEIGGEPRAVVMDVHPPTRFVPPAIVDVLEETVEATDDESFGTHHLMGLAMEEFPDRIVARETSDDGRVGFDAVWIASFDARRLHVAVVELIVELMEHAMSHAADDDHVAEFEEQLAAFDAETFVDRYREERDFEDEYDTFR